MKGKDATLRINRHHAERTCLPDIYCQTSDGQIRSRVVMVLEHRGIVHSVDVIARENQHIFGAASLQQIQVLIDGVGGAAVPPFTGPHLRGDGRDVFLQFGVVNGPSITQVLLERVRFVLGEYENSAEP